MVLQHLVTRTSDGDPDNAQCLVSSYNAGPRLADCCSEVHARVHHSGSAMLLPKFSLDTIWAEPKPKGITA